MSIDWLDPKSKVSTNFTVKECLWLPQWNRLANEADGLNEAVKAELIATAAKMDELRDLLTIPIIIHCWFRPTEYNKLVGGAAKSAHLEGKAVDFHFKNWNCDEARKYFAGPDCRVLKHLEMRMEDLPGANWIHLDTRAVPEGGNRIFKP